MPHFEALDIVKTPCHEPNMAVAAIESARKNRGEKRAGTTSGNKNRKP